MPNSTGHTKSWVPRGIFLFGTVSLGILLIFNKSLYKVPYLDWGLGAFIFCILALYFVIRGKIHTHELLVFMLPLLWIFYALLMTFFVVDKKHHLIMILMVGALSLLASGLIISVFTDKRVGKAIALINSFWVLINTILLLLWILNKMEYEGNLFSGLFGNRNNFSLQTVILLSLTYFFVRKGLWRTIIIILGVLLILFSQSLTGFAAVIFVLAYPKYLVANRNSRIKVLILSIGILFLTYFLVESIAARIDRFLLLFTDPQQLRVNESVFLRSWVYKEGFKLFLRNPIAGVGVDNARLVLIPPAGYLPPGIGMTSHSNFLEMLLNAGLPGFILHYCLLLYVSFKTKISHPYSVSIKTFIGLYFFISFVAITYDQFSTVFLFILPLFLYLFHTANRQIT